MCEGFGNNRLCPFYASDSRANTSCANCSKIINDRQCMSTIAQYPESLPSHPSEIRINERLVLFFGKSSPLSNHFPTRFTDGDGLIYSSVEQFYMIEKAMHFGDVELAALMRCQSNPYLLKRMGTAVRNFDKVTWQAVSSDVMYEACSMKFRQSRLLHDYLITTQGLLAEASPYDKFWGIGCDMHCHEAQYPQLWSGLNKLGQILTRLRNELLNEAFE